MLKKLLKIKPTIKSFPKNHTISLRPIETVNELDRNIVGQNDAKKAVAVALRNRFYFFFFLFLINLSMIKKMEKETIIT